MSPTWPVWLYGVLTVELLGMFKIVSNISVLFYCNLAWSVIMWCTCVPFGRVHLYALIHLKLSLWRVNPLKGLGHRDEPFRMERRVWCQTTFLCKGSCGPEVSISCTLQNPSFRRALWSGQFWALQFDGRYCFHSKVPFGGRYIPFGTMCV